MFGAALADQLARHSMRQSDIAKTAGVSQAYVSQLANSSSVSPQWVDIIAAATHASEDERQKLHQAAARARGYRV